MSDGAQELDYFRPTTSAIEASDQILHGRLLPFVQSQPVYEEIGPEPLTAEEVRDHIKKAIATTVTAEEAETETIEESEDEAPAPLPATTLNLDRVRKLLTGKSDTDFDTRIALLLSDAWNSSSIVERTLPADLIAFATDNPADWYMKNAARVKEISEDKDRLKEINQDTQSFEASSPLLRNALAIHEESVNWVLDDYGQRVEVSARLIILDALEERKRTLND